MVVDPFISESSVEQGMDTLDITVRIFLLRNQVLKLFYPYGDNSITSAVDFQNDFQFMYEKSWSCEECTLENTNLSIFCEVKIGKFR